MRRFAISMLVVVLVAFAGAYGARHDSLPPCTAGASSVGPNGKVTTTWLPQGCSHGKATP